VNLAVICKLTSLFSPTSTRLIDVADLEEIANYFFFARFQFRSPQKETNERFYSGG